MDNETVCNLLLLWLLVRKRKAANVNNVPKKDAGV